MVRNKLEKEQDKRERATFFHKMTDNLQLFTHKRKSDKAGEKRQWVNVERK